MLWSCSDLIFLAGSKEFSKYYPQNKEMLLIFCSIPSKKDWKPSVTITYFSISTISTPTENYLLSRLHRKLGSLAGSDAISSCSVSNSMHTFHTYCSFANTNSIIVAGRVTCTSCRKIKKL